MAAAYASIITLNYQVIGQVQLHHNRKRKPSYWEEQLKQVDSLNQITTFFQEFLENNSNNNELMEMLESRIRAIVDEAQDIIQSYMVNYSKSSSVEEYISSEQSFNGLDDVIENMNSLKEEVMKIKDGLQPQDLVHPAGSSGPSASRVNTPTIEDDGQLLQILDKLTRGQSDLLTIPITGMAGIGKTTLAKKVFDHPYRKSFDVCAWVTISQVYTIEAVLLVIVEVLTKESDLREYNWHQLGEKLHKHLKGRRFLIVMDDMWDTDIWDKLKRFIPDNNNESRILVTTRLLNVADYVKSSGDLYKMPFLDEKESWSLLCRKAFGQEGCPYPDFEEIAKRIAENCKGLPLSIIVIAGLLAKSNLTRELLELIVNDTNRTINSEENGDTLRMLLLSYNHLPIHLKPCLLYMGSYREDQKIHISTLINLWVAEGFLKPNQPKTLEEVAEDYLKDLIERNLVMVVGSTKGMETCVIHDLVRDLCLKESDRSEFLCFTKMPYDEVPFKGYVQQHRRIVLHNFGKKDLDDRTKYDSFLKYLESKPRTHSLSYRNHLSVDTSKLVSDNLKLLKVFSMFDPSTSRDNVKGDAEYIELYNLRYIDAYLNQGIVSLNKIRNLQTICGRGDAYFLGSSNYAIIEEVQIDIWKMLELRHLMCDGICLSYPSSCGLEEESVLENLQTLRTIYNFEFTEEVIKRIPNVKCLGVRYDHDFHKDKNSDIFDFLGVPYKSGYCLDILNCLHKLESLRVFGGSISVFPPALKMLDLEDCGYMDYVIDNIGQLPNLEELNLTNLKGDKWNSVEGQFISLKYLKMRFLGRGRIDWIAESSHFPALESLVIIKISVEIPFDFAYSSTLRRINVDRCRDYRTFNSAIAILKEQHSLGIDERILIREDIYNSDSEEDEVKYYN